mmetsp:Transcript_94825/g.246976  ORF Transcript_94825/g.246976 Transcript_94825/m.246976 type:complete len:236 (+) Transcript_94825:526-1233(+)
MRTPSAVGMEGFSKRKPNFLPPSLLRVTSKRSGYLTMFMSTRRERISRCMPSTVASPLTRTMRSSGRTSAPLCLRFQSLRRPWSCTLRTMRDSGADAGGGFEGDLACCGERCDSDIIRDSKSSLPLACTKPNLSSTACFSNKTSQCKQPSCCATRATSSCSPPPGYEASPPAASLSTFGQEAPPASALRAASAAMPAEAHGPHPRPSAEDPLLAALLAEVGRGLDADVGRDLGSV